MPDEVSKPQGTLLGFDFGHKRIGVAVGQTLTGSANALAVVSVSGKPDWQAISKILDEWKPVGLVVGLPLAADGGETSLSADARKFGRRLHGRYGLAVFYEDERLTSFSAEQQFIESRAQGGSRRKDAALKDAMAARIILQSWLQAG
jgi:putative Holliday junction resolvase